jgi:hypothetical protein
LLLPPVLGDCHSFALVHRSFARKRNETPPAS